jgi:microcystin-dependent protein
MTISSDDRVAGPFDGNDVTVNFPFTFKVFEEEDVLVLQVDEDGNETTLELGVDYSVALNADQDTSPGGTDTLLLGALATGYTLTITSTLDYLQPVQLTNNGGFHPSVINNAFDRMTIFAQQLASKVAQSVKIPLSDGALLTELPTRTVRANKVLLFDDEGNLGVSFSDYVDGGDSAVEAAAQSAAEAAASADEAAASALEVQDAKLIWQGAWLTATDYGLNDVIGNGGSSYICVEAHTSDTFATDLAAGKWDFLAVKGIDGTGLLVSVAAGVGITVDNTDSENPEVNVDVGTTEGKIVQVQADGKLPVLDGSNLTGLQGVPAGIISDFAGTTAPDGYLMCYGQAISRDTYAALFAAIDTTYGVGDGSTTFNVPDCRGRGSVGKDDMGGTSANRLTGQTGGVNGDVLGATGGAETHTITTTQMPAHTHTVSFQSASADAPGAAGFPHNAGSGISVTSSSTGGGGAHNNVQPSIVFNKIIKT